MESVRTHKLIRNERESEEGRGYGEAGRAPFLAAGNCSLGEPQDNLSVTRHFLPLPLYLSFSLIYSAFLLPLPSPPAASFSSPFLNVIRLETSVRCNMVLSLSLSLGSGIEIIFSPSFSDETCSFRYHSIVKVRLIFEFVKYIYLYVKETITVILESWLYRYI